MRPNRKLLIDQSTRAVFANGVTLPSLVFFAASFLPCDAMCCTVFVIVILSVCLSVTLVDCVHMVRLTIMISSPYGSPIITVRRFALHGLCDSNFVGSRALSFSDPSLRVSVCPSFVLSFVLSVRNFGAKYLGNEAR